MYRDYPISRSLFHLGISINHSLNCRPVRRYVNGTSTVLLFARTNKDGDFGNQAIAYSWVQRRLVTTRREAN